MVSIYESNRGMCGDGFTTLTREELRGHKEHVKKQKAMGTENFEEFEENLKDPENFLLIDEEDINNSDVWNTLKKHLKLIKQLEKEIIVLKKKKTWYGWFTDLFSCCSCCK